MTRAELNRKAPEIGLMTLDGSTFRLSEQLGKNVLVVLHRGFTWDFCQKHMAQLRDASKNYAKSDTLVLIVGPDNAEAFQKMWLEEEIPFIGLPDPTYSVLKTFGKQVGLFNLGRLPTQILIDKQGYVRYVHYGHAPTDMPFNAEILGLIKNLNH